ncbi:hypothetical protein BDN72DRAFT_839457 [Pluteus cervinus]|uniref:Uncharacterized protein n=1 Tax=Pluteus cervinus TaxID=181527 RepID=A0ACD3AXZ0_9AGAR|nr:hypothetical protein BDN72DRAFT_839457 [Pluteus cervinus]
MKNCAEFKHRVDYLQIRGNAKKSLSATLTFERVSTLAHAYNRLTSLSLRGFSLSHNTLLSIPSTLRELELSNVSIESDSDPIGETPGPSPRPCLRKFSITTSDSLVSWLRQPHCRLDLSQLETFLLCHELHPVSLGVVRSFLDLVAPSVEHLFLTVPHKDTYRFTNPPLPVRELVKIQSLSFRLGTRSDQFGWIIDFLRNLPDPQLKEICIYTRNLDWGLAHASSGWPALDSEFSLSPFNLTRVYLYPYAWKSQYTREEEDEALLAALFRLVPTLHGQGRFTVIPSFGPSCPTNNGCTGPLSSLRPTYIPVGSSPAEYSNPYGHFRGCW